MPEAIYKAQVNTPFGLFLVAVLEAEPFAKDSIVNLVQCEMMIAWGNFRVKEVTKSNRRILNSMTPVKGANSNGIQWGWMKRIKE